MAALEMKNEFCPAFRRPVLGLLARSGVNHRKLIRNATFAQQDLRTLDGDRRHAQGGLQLPGS